MLYKFTKMVSATITEIENMRNSDNDAIDFAIRQLDQIARRLQWIVNM